MVIEGTTTQQEPRPGVSGERLHDLLIKSSRTFALAIPQLGEPTRREVTIAYLLFRIADTFEDASVEWGPRLQLAALADFSRLLDQPSREAAQKLSRAWLRRPPSDHPGYVELLEETPTVIAALLELSPQARRIIAGHSVRTAELMAGFVTRTAEDGVLRLSRLEDLRSYCYAVAGLVGEMLTELFLLGRDRLAKVGPYLRERAALFGEGLQLVNILKDSASDADEGRHYLPEAVERAEVFGLARQDLAAAAEYCLAIQRAGGPDGIVAFTALPVELAWATLDKVEADGPGSKISREEVFRLFNRMHRALIDKRPVLEARPA